MLYQVVSCLTSCEEFGKSHKVNCFGDQVNDDEYDCVTLKKEIDE